MALPAFHVHLDVFAVLGALTAVYLVAARRHERSTGERLEPRRRALFLGGVAVLLLGATWPMHDLAEGYLYSVHMVQHMLFTFIAAPLLLTGTPPWMWRELLRPAPVRAAWAFVTRPLMALIVANGVLLFTHWPEVVALSVGSELVHFLLHALLLGSAVVMWWPVLSPLPELPPLSRPAQLLYLFFQSLAPTIPASFLTFGTEPLYAVYATFPRIWGIGALTDQLIAGLVMKLVGGAILWVVIATIFFRWGREESSDGWDALKFRNVEREIRTGMGR
ncbi:MAG TPA: cytochrome c oxidase assembly protein [Actinomycetota bacterium]|nr:cytochrome c oxidase assembly protein [Actinomycetota bacterium]